MEDDGQREVRRLIRETQKDNALTASQKVIRTRVCGRYHNAIIIYETIVCDAERMTYAAISRG